MIFYGPKEAQGVPEMDQKSHEAATRWGLSHHPRALPPILSSPRGSPDLSPTLKILINRETSENKPRSGVPPLKACGATKNQSRPCSGTLPEGESLSGVYLHHPGALHDEEGVVHPRAEGIYKYLCV